MADSIEGNVPLTVNFTNSSVGDELSYSWDFGDGGTSYDASPRHTYNSTGTFNAILTVTNVYGSNSKTSSVVVTQDTGDDRRDEEEEKREEKKEEKREEKKEGNGNGNGKGGNGKGGNGERNGGNGKGGNGERNGGNGRNGRR
jgi:PKD repeat protein